MLRERIKWQLFPGLNLHARLRYRRLPNEFQGPVNGEERRVLDAGCGNGMLAYQSYLKGNRVLGVSLKEGEVARNKKMFNRYLGIPADKLSFQVHNLYDAKSLGADFDEVICTEVLEHIERDTDVCRSFYEILKPGGVLHLCCPNSAHPDHQTYHLDESESGGHVRSGYTWETYKALLEPIGFEVSEPIGLGGPLRQACNKRITQAQHFGRLPLGLAAFAVLAPLAVFDTDQPAVPYCLYVTARKPRHA
jgi:2-polyprenyl-3-methyl-5-hydroxy-6-metoxy-1,4-benzoquinol methylase